MRTTIALAAIASLSSSAFASYGRFPCDLLNGDGTVSADPNQCANAVLRNPGAGDKGSLPNPTNPECALDTLNGGYACGIAGAGCISDANCDVGTCVGGVCTGAPGAACGTADDACLGYLYCTDINGAATASQTCGGLGAFCQDFGLLMNAMDGATVVALSSQTCAQSAQGEVYCGFDTAVCSLRVTTIGGDCSADPGFACGTTAAGQQLACTGNGGTTCALAAVPSGRARARRNAGFFKRNACPASHTACAIDGRAGFECIDTRTNIEQCGACATEGGKDCSAIPGVDAVGCVAGSCEIWSCQDGYMYDSASDSCLSA